MTRHVQLPQLAGGIFLTDSGMETTLVFHEGMELPYFASFTLLNSEDGRKWVRGYYERHLQLAQDACAGFILDTPTWRANADWGAKLGLTPEELAALNADAVAMMKEIRALHAGRVSPIVISGNIGPRGDGYVPGEMMSADEAEAYHQPQIETFAKAGVDMASALTLSYVAEAIGIVRASAKAGVASVISFTLETDGRLPSGQSLADAVKEADAATDAGAAYYMINCAHPDHFESVFTGAAWEQRIRGVRANASRRSHAELNDATELDAGNPEELAAQYAALLVRMPHVNVLGGCCGTDHRHVAAIGHACCTARNAQQKAN